MRGEALGHFSDDGSVVHSLPDRRKHLRASAHEDDEVVQIWRVEQLEPATEVPVLGSLDEASRQRTHVGKMADHDVGAGGFGQSVDQLRGHCSDHQDALRRTGVAQSGEKKAHARKRRGAIQISALDEVVPEQDCARFSIGVGSIVSHCSFLRSALRRVPRTSACPWERP